MRRFYYIARRHGIRALTVRGIDYARLRIHDLWRDVFARRSERRALGLPKSPKSLCFSDVAEPRVTVVVAEGASWMRTNRCLRSLEAAQREVPLEAFVVHEPALRGVLGLHKGVHLLPLRGGSPFGGVLRRIVGDARGRYLFVLNQDAIVAEGAMSQLAALLDSDASVAVAMPRAEGSAGGNRDDDSLDYASSVTNVSAAGCMICLEFLRSIIALLPADRAFPETLSAICAQARDRGMRCVYQPQARLLTDNVALLSAPARATGSLGSLLVLDDHVPFDDRDAGSRRMAELLAIALSAGWRVVFGSIHARPYRPYAERLAQAGVEVILGFDCATFARLTERGEKFDAVWLSRPNVAAAFLENIRRLQANARVIYDTVDLHYLRLSRQEAAQSKSTKWEKMERTELDLARRSDVVVVTSAFEQSILRAKGLPVVRLVGLAEKIVAGSVNPRERNGILFLGNYAHEPNVDAAIWLANEIMPVVLQSIPGASLTLAGADPTPAVTRLGNRRVSVPGFTANLDSTFASHRVFAAPLRFGAGLKGKVLLALAHGVPVVSTAVAAEGIAESGEDLIVADDAPSFAQALSALCSDDEMWLRYAAGATRAAQRFSRERLAEQFDLAVRL